MIFNILYNIILTLSATLLLPVIYFIDKKAKIPFLNEYNEIISYVIMLLIPLGLTWLCIFLKRWLSYDTIESSLQNVELANNSFLPSYLGYFFVALSISNINTLIYVYILVFLFTFRSRALYFNPIFLLFGYHFYYVLVENDTIKIFLISKRIIRIPRTVKLINLRRINDFTYMDEDVD